MRFVHWMLAGAALAAVAPAVAGSAGKASPAEAGAAKLAKAVEGRVAGEPVRCINMRQIRSSTIIDGTAIVYNVGGTLYVNKPTSGAESLDDGDIMVTKTSGAQLCDLDLVQLVDRASRFPTGFVGLGKFVPYAKVARAN